MPKNLEQMIIEPLCLFYRHQVAKPLQIRWVFRLNNKEWVSNGDRISLHFQFDCKLLQYILITFKNFKFKDFFAQVLIQWFDPNVGFTKTKQ